MAELIRVGWFKEVRIKSQEGQAVRTLPAARSRLVMVRKDLQNHIRSIFAEIGLRFPSAVGRAFTSRVRDLTENNPALQEVNGHLLAVYENVITEEAKLDRKLRDMARSDDTVRRFITVPGIGSITALAYRHAIDDPARFKSAQTVGASLGMTPRRHQSGNINLQGKVVNRRANGTPYRRAKGTPCLDCARLM